MAAIGMVTVWLFSMILSSILMGYALSVLWGWFMVPTFGLPHLAIAPAIGLSLVVHCLTVSTTYHEDERSYAEKLLYSMVISVLMPLIVLSMGYVVHLFM